MKGLTLICLILVTATATAEEIDRRLDAASDGVVTISNVAGSVEVSGWSRDQVEVTGTLGSNVEELVFERDGNEIEVSVRLPRHSNRHTSSELVVKVPKQSSVKVIGVSCDIDVKDVFGSLHLQTVSGDIDSEVHAADIEINTVSGDIDIQGDDKAMHAELTAVSGDIEVQNLAGEIEAASVSGDVTLVNSNFSRARLDTTNGDIIFAAGLAKNGKLSVETTNGDLAITLHGSVSARFDVETFSGDIDNCFGPKPVRTSEYTPGRQLKFSEGKGEGRVTINTFNGDVRLCKE